MARISDDELERIKREVPVAGLVRAHGVELKAQGDNLIGHCPFHDDKTPSLIVTPSKNLWHCMGACQKGGTCIDWAMAVGGVSFRHAVEILRTNGERAARRTVRTLPSPISLDGDDQKLFDDVAGYYHARLKETAAALAYLEKRGLRSTEMVEKFKLGFADRTLGLRLPMKNRAVGSEMRTKLQRIGIIRESGHEHLNGSLVIPILDENGHVRGMYGRKITENLRPGTPLHLYLPGPHRGVFNVEGLKASREVILCESLIDALTFWCAGYRNVTSSYGVEGFSDEILDALKVHGVEKVLIAYDRDDAGDQAAEKLSVRLIDDGFEVLRIKFPHKMDANEYALSVKPAEQSLGILVRGAEWMGKGKRISVDNEGAPKIEEERAAKEEAPAVVQPLGAVAPPTTLPTSQTTPTTTTTPKPVPAQPTAAPTTPAFFETRGEDLCKQLGDRHYRVRGFEKNTGSVLKVSLTVRKGDRFHVDSLDMVIWPMRARFIKVAAHELGVDEEVVKKDIGQIYSGLEELQEARVKALLAPKEKAVVLTDEERAKALEFLEGKDLLKTIDADFARCGVVGEEIGKLTAYLAATSRKLEKPLAVIVRSASGAGKSSLMEAVLSFMPPEEQVRFSAMTSQAPYYMGENLKHKILALAEEEGAERASYALKLLQSEGRLSIASTSKDPSSGHHQTTTYEVEGPIMLFETTTRVDLDEELLNRCIELEVDEGREQTRAIHEMQRRQQTREWLSTKRERAEIVAKHQNAQRLLKPMAVYNRFADFLTFPDGKTRLRRDNGKYLALIAAIALLHQYQRPRTKIVDDTGREIEAVEVELADIAAANRIMHHVLGRSIDEVPPQTRRLLHLIEEMVKRLCDQEKRAVNEVWFSRREVREFTGWGNTQLKLHMTRLVELEYLLVHRGQRGQSFVYELAYESGTDDSTARLSGLSDVDAVARAYDAKWSGVVGGRPGGGRGPERTLSLRPDAETDQRSGQIAKRMNGVPHESVSRSDAEAKR